MHEDNIIPKMSPIEWKDLSDGLTYNPKLVRKGRFGNIYKGKNSSGEKYEVNKLQPSNARSESSYLKEIELKNLHKKLENLKSKTSHINLVKIHATLFLNHGLYIFHEKCDYNLSQFIQRRYVDEQLDVDTANNIMLQCATGMNFLHSLDHPMIHRYLWPMNLLILEENDQITVKILDHCMADVFGESRHVIWSQSHKSVLSKQPLEEIYKGPEWEEADILPPCEATYDVFCLGAVFHALLSYSREKVEEDAYAFVPELPETDENVTLAELVKSRTYPRLFQSCRSEKEDTLQQLISNMLKRKEEDRPLMNIIQNKLYAIDQQHLNRKFEDSTDNTVEMKICRKIEEKLRKVGPLNSKSADLIKLLSHEEQTVVLQTGSMQDFIEKFSDNIVNEDGNLSLKESGIFTPLHDEPMAQLYLDFMSEVNRDEDLRDKILGSYFNSKSIYIHIPGDDRKEVERILHGANFTKYKNSVEITSYETSEVGSSVLTQTSGILPFMGPGSRLMTDKDRRIFERLQSQKSISEEDYEAVLDLDYGTLGGFAMAKDATHEKDIYAITAHHVVEDDLNIVVYSRDTKEISIQEIFEEDVTITMQDCSFLSNRHKGKLHIDQQNNLVDVASVKLFVNNYELFEFEKSVIINRDYRRENYITKTPVFMLGATSDQQRGNVMCDYTVKYKVSQEECIRGKVFLVGQLDPKRRWKTICEFSAGGDSGAFVYLEQQNGNLHALGILQGELIGSIQLNLDGDWRNYFNVSACVYMDPCIRALEAEHQMPLELYHYRFRPLWRLRRQQQSHLPESSPSSSRTVKHKKSHGPHQTFPVKIISAIVFLLFAVLVAYILQI